MLLSKELGMFARLDNWLKDKVKRLAEWLQDWFGISQRQLEKICAIMVLFSQVAEWACKNKEDGHIGWYEILSGLCLLYVAYCYYRRVANFGDKFYRLAWGLASLVSVATLFIPSNALIQARNVIQVVLASSLTTLSYLVISDIEDKKKQARLSLKKLVELFGTSWTETPAGSRI